MATNNIQFKIGTAYVGEGFIRAQKDIKTVNQSVKKGAEVVTQLQGALGQMDAGAAKALGAMTGLAQAILTLNVTTIATQVSIIAINRYFGEMKEKAEAAQKKAEELHASMQKAFDNALSTRITSITGEIKSSCEEFERITKHANQFAAALEGVRNAEANGGVIQLQVEKLNKLLEAHSEEERTNIEAAYNLKIAIQKSANSAASWQAKIDEANQSVVDNEKRMANVTEQITKIGDERRQLEETMISAKASGDKQWIEIQKHVTSLWKQEEALEQKKLDIEAQTDVLRLEEQKIKAEANNAHGQATLEIRNAELAEKKLTEAMITRQVKEAAAKDAAELKTASDKLEAKETVNVVEAQRNVNQASKDLAQAEATYASKLREYSSSDLFINTIRDYAKKRTPGGLLPVDIQKGIQIHTADMKVDDAIRNGAITTVKEADRLQRQAMREARNQITKQQTQQLNEAKKYKRLQAMNPKTICSADKEFMRKYEKIQKAAEERKKQLDDAKKAVEQQKEDLKKTRENLDAIKRQLEKLGIK